VIALLIRHGDTAALGRFLAGREPGLHLSGEGQRQAGRLPARTARYEIRAVYTSPLERARQMAAPLAEAHGLTAVALDALLEVDFGHWTGKAFTVLDGSPGWQAFNTHRRSAQAPGGERLADVQARIVMLLERLRDEHGSEAIALVSHAEVIRSAVLHYLTASLDLFQRIEISPASITAIEMQWDSPRFLCINDQDEG